MNTSIDERVAQTAPRISNIIEKFERGDSSQDILRHDQVECLTFARRNARAETTQKCVVQKRLANGGMSFAREPPAEPMEITLLSETSAANENHSN